MDDAYNADKQDDPDCLLCAEPLDLSDLNFRPCQCGLQVSYPPSSALCGEQADIQICQFCYNKLLGSDSRCPGCRRPYDAKAVIFQPVDFEE
jgi:CCR4-NOT transcription complex subunit 4